MRGGEGRREEELATTSLEFEYRHREGRCEMLIGGDDFSNDAIVFQCLPSFALVSASYLFAEN